MIDFTSRQLRAFLLVAQHGSFSRAAGALFITPSGVSILIRELEVQLGVRLFDRTTRRVALTVAGVELLDAAQRSLQELDSAMSRIGRSATDSGLVLSLGAPLSMAPSVLPQALKEFRSRRPELQLQLFDGDAATIMQRVESGALDMGLGIFFKHLPGIQRIPLFRFSLVVIRPDTGQATPVTTSWSALKREKLISLPSSLPLQQFVDKQLDRAGVVHQPSFMVNYSGTLIGMVEAGEGVAIVPSFLLPASRNPRITMNRLTHPAVHLDFHQIRRGGRKLAAVPEAFASFLQTYLGNWAKRSGVF